MNISIKDRMDKYGIRKASTDEEIKKSNFAYSPGIVEKHVNTSMRAEHRRTMSFGAYSYKRASQE